MNIIFLDIDGVLNCQVFYNERAEGDHINVCADRVSWLNEVCKNTDAKVVISSVWRYSGLEYCINKLKEVGATFDIIDVTPNLRGQGCLRGNEILQWIKDNEELLGKPYHEYYNYVIIDDDSDMLYWQKDNFFQTDCYAGLTPNICYKIERFFKYKTNIL